MCEDISKIDWQPVYQANDVNIATNYFNSKLRKIFDTHAPIIEKRTERRPCKWLSKDIKKTMQNRDKQLRKARKSNNESD